MTAEEKEKLVYRAIWMSMIQMIPRFGRDKARAFVQEGKYSCPRALLDAYNDSSLSVEEKEALVNHLVTGGQGASQRAYVKLSKSLYNLFMSTDPDILINIDSTD